MGCPHPGRLSVTTVPAGELDLYTVNSLGCRVKATVSRASFLVANIEIYDRVPSFTMSSLDVPRLARSLAYPECSGCFLVRPDA